MIETLTTFAERKAQEAEQLPAFDGINLLGIKRKVETILNLIGREGIFDEYTVHDISHIDSMLNLLDWLIVEETKSVMSSADWLMTVLAIYFHDIGMLVTKTEYENRDRSGFLEFCQSRLFAEEAGVDYKDKIDQLKPDERQRFLYQEFVRFTHAERIREWVLGKAPDRLGCSHAAMTEIFGLLEPLGQQFQRDLGFICESHHLDDLSDLRKYKVSQPYGDSEAETANLHFAAILLRTSDLLHITRNRTPSIAFRLINPTDPISQSEWAKQMAVRRVRSQMGIGKEGVPDEAAPRNTIEVHAYFTKPDGFFGLTSYLAYAQTQLQKSHEWTIAAKEAQGAKHQFPWRFIDDQWIETEGFLRESFEFTLDQARILDLLTGHTLYNETTVVLRELVQNSLDAIRLRRHISTAKGVEDHAGRVSIHWNSASRCLQVRDNGTGMTQSMIERHLLKVGASRYQDAEFKKLYPSFSSISRFGIGVLSTFMIADHVEIITCHDEEEQARILNLRSVHGKYLIQLLDKSDVRIPEEIRTGGTSIQLHIRPSAELKDVLGIARYWIVIPECEVVVCIDDGEPVSVGYGSPDEVLYDALERSDYVRWDMESDTVEGDIKYRARVRVEQVEIDGLTIAFALRWSEYFKEWSFLAGGNVRSDNHSWPLGTCVEGIRVETYPPGYEDLDGIAAIANAKGQNAPKTNVARSGLEQTPEFDKMIRSVYCAYCDHVMSELAKMQSERDFSLTWAVQEARYLMRSLLNARPRSGKLLSQSIFDLPLILVETSEGRRSASIRELQGSREFWTVDGQFFRSAERMIREVSSSASIGALIKALGVASVDLPQGIIVCDTSVQTFPYSETFNNKEVDKVRIVRGQRRLDLRWSECSDSPRWASISAEAAARFNLERPRLFVANSNIEIEGQESDLAVCCFDRVYVLPGSPISAYLLDQWKLAQEKKDEASNFFVACLFFLADGTFRGDRRPLNSPEHIKEVFSGNKEHRRELMEGFDFQEPFELFTQGPFKVFDSSVWARKEDEL